VPLVNYAAREITCKIVYYGPGRSGKTTNLHYIHERLPAGRRARWCRSRRTATARSSSTSCPWTWASSPASPRASSSTRCPGQSYYSATRRLVLQGADGIVFVADSRRRQMDENVESMQDLHANLAEHGIDARTMPLVLQYNKQDLPRDIAADAEELGDALNFRGVPEFAADAVRGTNVFETMRAAAGLVLRRLTAAAPAA
jgi:signal recognition particle receptor subunit beta